MQTSEEKTYDQLKSLIISNKLPQGEFLSQRKLAESVGATIVTLRSSLRLLENDGLVENVPKWGVRIPVENETSLCERYYVRELLEIGALELLLERKNFDAREILAKKALACDTLEFTDSSSFRDFALLHSEFHLTLTQLSGNQLLTQQLSRLNFRSMMLLNSKHCWDLAGENTNHFHHRDLVEAIFVEDRQSALSALKNHIRRGRDKEIAILKLLNS